MPDGPHHTDAWRRCVDEVGAKGGVDPYAVCTASLERTGNVYEEKNMAADKVAPEVTAYRQVEKDIKAQSGQQHLPVPHLPPAPPAPPDALTNNAGLSVPAPGEMNRRTSIPASLNSDTTIEQAVREAAPASVKH